MTFWLSTATLTLAVVLIALVPVLRTRPLRQARHHDIAVYRDQLRELEAEASRGAIGEAQARAARLEIERRMLAAGKREEAEPEPASPRRAVAIALALTILISGLSLAVYGRIGHPGLPDQPLASRTSEPAPAVAGDLGERAEALARRLEADGGTADDYWMLAQSFEQLGEFGRAAAAYESALALEGEEPAILAAYSEALIRAADGRVEPQAEQVLERLLALQPRDPRARYYLGLAAAQAQEFEVALQRWQALYRETPEDAPWRELLQRSLIDIAGLSRRDPQEVLPDLSAAEIAALQAPPASSGAVDEGGMDDWLARIEAAAEAGRHDEAGALLERARERFAAAPFVLQRLNALEARLGLGDGPAPGPRRGPTDEQMAAARDLTPEQQNAMIAGMVDGLAARLEQQPDDLEGWLMLIRSYAVLGREADARAALERARSQFGGREQALAALAGEAARLGLN